MDRRDFLKHTVAAVAAISSSAALADANPSTVVQTECRNLRIATETGDAPFAFIRAVPDRIISLTVCTRPFRAAGARIETEKLGRKTIVHNYGHGGSGWSLSWGSATVAVRQVLATREREIAVIGCGVI